MLLKEYTFIRKKYNKLFYAGLIGLTLTTTADIFDSIASGILLDADAVAAIELITPIVFVLYFFSVLIGFGTSILYAKAIGANQIDESKKIVGTTFISNFILGIILCVLVIVLREPILSAYGVTGQILEYSRTYYNYNLLSTIGLPLYWSIYYFILRDGDEAAILLSDILVSVVNISLPFILGSFLGMKGIALAKPLAYFVGLLCMLPHFFSKRSSIRFKFAFDINYIKEAVKCSSAQSFVTFYTAITSIAINKMIIINYGDKFLAVYAVINFIRNITAIFASPIQAGGVFIANAYGEDNPHIIKNIMKIVHKYCLALSMGLMLLIYFVSPYLPTLFGIVDEELLTACKFACIILPLKYVPICFSYAYIGYYPLVNKTKYANLLSALLTIITPLAIVLPMGTYISFNAISIGYLIVPFATILLTLLFMYIKKDINKAPLLLNKVNEKEYHYDLYLNKESIVELRDKVINKLNEISINTKLINEISVIIEDTLMYIYRRNDNKVLCELSLLISDSKIRLFIKDDGKVFDLLKEGEKASNLRAYIIDRMSTLSNDKSYSVSISFNRNIFSFDISK